MKSRQWRFRWVCGVWMSIFAGLLGVLSVHAFDEPVRIMPDVYDVRSFGAKGDGVTDDTAAFQEALNAAGKDGMGGRVYAGRGDYLIAGNLSIPAYVSLEGLWQIPTSWSEYKGTTLLATADAGNATGTPFITLHSNSTLKGLAIFYPDQVPTESPIPYPWTISIGGKPDASGGVDNCSIVDVLIVNPYMAVDFGSVPNGRHYIRNLYAQPILKGLYVNQCIDVGRVENVHFWPFWTCNNPELRPLEMFIAQHGEAFIFGRTDWEYVLNTFCWGYKVGYRFIRTEAGLTNGNFLGIGADATNISVLVEDCYPYGLLITNGEFVSFLEPEPTSIVVKETNTGTIQFQNCSFWGPAKQIANIAGTGSVTFNNCNFSYWDSENHPAIEASGGNLIVNACHFNVKGKHVLLEKGLGSAVISSNRFAGRKNIVNNSLGKVESGLNVSTQ